MSVSTTFQGRMVGPLDKRRRMTRCLACAKRRIKCEGGFPCVHCIRRNTIKMILVDATKVLIRRGCPSQIRKHSGFTHLISSGKIRFRTCFL
ncbi:hypothetical protein ACN38_g10684 [Penicillium nordicum]|uniref:Zn(2)-C6 fungal-type domain-containing protein n=1 Tax=Penicillium nordicum TaxID=229535 RepID=A0A0M9WBH2_9EURO|nr:hypothetical protein ACN38_g10684 [Penicillium nordicum]